MKITGADIGVVNNINTYNTPGINEGPPGGVKSPPQGRPGDRKEQSGPRLEQDDLGKAVSQLNDTMEAYTTGLRFEIHEKSGEMMVKVINEEDDTVIREIPPEKVLDMVAHFKRILGIIVDKLI